MSSCLFCDIIAGKIPCSEVHNDDNFLAFKDINPKAPTHILVIPKRHISSLADLTSDDAPDMGNLMVLGTEIARKLGISDSGYRLIINCGENGGQTVGHIHLHVMGGRSMSWPPG